MFDELHIGFFFRNEAGRGTHSPTKVGMGNPQYCRYECRNGGKKLNRNGDGNGIPTPDSTYCHP
ncbi:unnamed protein product [Prunus armeniaca]